MADLKIQVGDLLRDARKRKGVTLAELGKAVGLTNSTLSQIENGKQNTTIDTIERILEALDAEAGFYPPPGESGSTLSEIIQGFHQMPKDAQFALLYIVRGYTSGVAKKTS